MSYINHVIYVSLTVKGFHRWQSTVCIAEDDGGSSFFSVVEYPWVCTDCYVKRFK